MKITTNKLCYGYESHKKIVEYIIKQPFVTNVYVNQENFLMLKLRTLLLLEKICDTGGRKPGALSAGALRYVSEDMGCAINMRELAVITGCTEVSIRNNKNYIKKFISLYNN